MFKYFFWLGLISTKMDSLQAKANFSRVCQLLIDKGGNALRGVLQTEIHTSPPPSTLDSLLKANKKSLQRLRYSVINTTQWKLLFPASGSPDINSFDITLLTIVLRNICGLPSPAAGWSVMPPASDISVSAEILRIKMFRNEVYGHISSAQLDNTKFETLWREISKPLVKLGIPRQEIHEIKKAPLSSEEESYIQELKEWKELEDELISKLNDVEVEVGIVKKKISDVESKVDFVQEKVINISDSVSHVENEIDKLRTKNVQFYEIDKLTKFFFKGKIEELSKKFQSDTRKWFFDDFKQWLTDSKSSVMILIAGPGVGKSVLSARLCQLYEDSGQLAACHFCDFRTPDYRDPYRILQSLASQMCDNLDGFRDKLTEALSREHSRDSLSDAFRVLLNDPLQALDRTEPALIVVDALDESKTPIKSELLDLISDQFSQLPKWINIFISSRPELQVRGKLGNLNPVEIRPDDDKHNLDLKHFIECYFPSMNKIEMESLVSKCEGSFLYAYYLVKEIKQVDLGIKPNVNVDIPKGISGFYEKQFERLKKDLQCYEDKTGVSIFENFINVIAASEQPLPFRFLFACMDIVSEQFKVRKTIVGIMSEILPVYDDCLTVFHKSLWDWLMLDGYEEHAYAADVADGYKRLWRACKKVYTDIDSLSSVSDFQISQEKRYALENGVEYFVNVDGTAEDWEWLVHVKVNYLKFFYCLESVKNYLRFRVFDILEEHKSRISDDFFWHLFQLCTFLEIASVIFKNELVPNMYLQYFGSKQFLFVHNAISSKMFAREMLEQENAIWLEEMTNETDSSFKIISKTVFGPYATLKAISASPDNKILAMRSRDQIKLYELPSLKSIFKLDLNELGNESVNYWKCVVFSPDSSYFLLNSLQTCVSIKNQSIVPFIPHGPAEILSSSFSSCGTKLVSAEKQSIKLWDVIKKELLTESWRDFDLFKPVTSFSGCTSYIFLFESSNDQLSVFDSTALNILETTRTDTCSTKLDDCIQIISPRSSTSFLKALSLNIKCWQLTTGENILCTTKHCSMPFVWNGRKCVMTSSCTLALVVYDYVNQQVIDTFQISSLPSYDSINYIANLGENNFLICLEDNFVFVLSLKSSSEFSAFSIDYCTYPIFCSLSPDNLYVACSYGSPTLKIMNVDSGKTLQTVAPKQKPTACWWSELYLWVVCEGSAVVKYSYTSTHSNIVESYAEKCSIEFDGAVLKFEEGVLVCNQRNRKISISKICHKSLCPQQILDSNLGNIRDVVIGSDGCTVLIYDIRDSCYELWEMGSENKWILHSTGKFNPLTWGGFLAGKENSRSLLWLLNPDFDLHETSSLCSINFSDATSKNVVHQLPMELIVPDIIYVDSKLLICLNTRYIHFIHVPNGTVITSLYVGHIRKSFFVPSKRLLFLFIGNGIIKHFKIHNIDRYLPPK